MTEEGAAAGSAGPWQDERDDRELLRAHLDGDPGAFTELVRRHQHRLWAVAMHTLRDREEAADAVQDALISAFRRADSYRGEAAVATWLYRVVVNACLDRLRRQRARPTTPLGDLELAAPHEDPDTIDVRLDVHAALALLPQAQRAAIILVDLHGMSVAQAAAVLGVAEGTVKSRCSRGRTEMARIMRSGRGRNQGSPPDVPSRGLRASRSSGSATGGGER